jgi:hypothetical protein
MNQDESLYTFFKKNKNKKIIKINYIKENNIEKSFLTMDI